MTELAYIGHRLSGIDDPLALLGGLFAFAPVALQIYDADGHCLLVNKAFRELFGSEPPPSYNVLRDERAAQNGVLDLIHRAFAGETVRLPTLWCHPGYLHQASVPEGRRVAIERLAFPLYDRQDQVRHVALVFKDHTETLQARAGQDEIMTRLQSSFERMPLGMVLLDAQFRFLYCNPAAERLFGYRLQEIQGRHPDEVIIPPAWREVVADHFRHLSQDETGTHMETENLTRDGRLLLCEWHHTPLFDTQGGFAGVMSLCRDVTERRRLQEQLRASQKMEAIGRLAGGIAHDFNNMLSALGGFAELVLDRLSAQDPVRPDVLKILSTCEQAAALTRQLLALGRRQLLQPVMLDVNRHALEMQDMLRRLLGENIELVYQLDPDLPPVSVDPGQLSQVILNLVLNGRDAMPRGGRLILETASAVLDEDYCRTHNQVTPGRYAMLAVTDNGVGIDRATQERLFEPFFTTKQAGKGTGLGLATVHGIIRQSGGHIWVYSEPGQGTTFKIYLPTAPSGAEADQAEALLDPQGSETVLVVEDEDRVRELVCRALQRFGYQVLAAGDAEEALERSCGHAGDIHLLLTDVVLPRTSGYELALRLRQLRPGLRVLFTSGYPESAARARASVEKGADFIAKPLGAEALARKVREVLDSPEDS
ncbi:MAG TPA: PAS domain S-box protein [Candidatus Nitrosotenuis sp.]|nr:PAS domain S-box protein [Candidatus Nitrosotenuis sp.]